MLYPILFLDGRHIVRHQPIIMTIMIFPVWHDDRRCDETFQRDSTGRIARSLTAYSITTPLYHLSNIADAERGAFYDVNDYDAFLKVIEHHIGGKALLMGYLLTPISYDLVIRFNSYHLPYSPSSDKVLFNALAASMSHFSRMMNRRYNTKGGCWKRPYHIIDIVDRRELECTLEGFLRVRHALKDVFGFPVVAHDGLS